MITIRNATYDDLKTIIDMGEDLQNESREFEPLLVFKWQDSFDHYATELRNQNAKIIVAEDPTAGVVGYQYSYVTLLDYLERQNTECTLEALYVSSDFRGQGIAKELVRHAERLAIDEKKADRIMAGIYVGNAASEAVHIKDGFTPYYTEYVKFTSMNE